MDLKVPLVDEEDDDAISALTTSIKQECLPKSIEVIGTNESTARCDKVKEYIYVVASQAGRTRTQIMHTRIMGQTNRRHVAITSKNINVVYSQDVRTRTQIMHSKIMGRKNRRHVVIKSKNINVVASQDVRTRTQIMHSKIMGRINR